MTRTLESARLVVASHNSGKVLELEALFGPFGVACVAAAELGLAAPEETGLSFTENAELKARAAATASGLPAIADDSGLSVEALGGEPGIHSARWGGPDRDFAMAMAEVERRLQALAEGARAGRRAAFIAALTLAWPDGHVESFLGRVDGVLVWPPRGAQGFGYDPIFVADGQSRSFGEMEPDDKHAISHRADAFRQLAAACFGAPDGSR